MRRRSGRGERATRAERKAGTGRRGRKGPRDRAARGARPVVLLGPESPEPRLGEVIADLEERGNLTADAPLAAVTAGWREQEGEPGVVDPAVADRTTDLELYRRAEEVAQGDPELASAHAETQNRLKTLRRAYNARLAALIEAHAAVRELVGAAEVVSEELEAALEAIRALDARHLDRVVEIREAFRTEFRPDERDLVVRHRGEIRELLGPAEAVVIAGGHIASLLNRLRLFGLGEAIGDRVVVAWSAGAMAVASRVVLFHDRPPWGGGHAEAFDRGLGLVAGVIPLPHASARLALDDESRTARLAARLAPDAPVLLDPGVRLDWTGSAWVARSEVRRLDPAGGIGRFEERAA